MKIGQLLVRLLQATALLATQAAFAQPVPGPGYLLRAVDGDNDVGAHFALAARPGGANGFFYLADQGRLFASRCVDLTCSDAISLTNPAFDRGRYVSATPRPALLNRPILAYYDATNGDLMTLDCLSTECLFGTERTLESAGNVGQDTAIAIDPATGFALISYYDVTNGDIRLYRCATAACDSGSSVLVNSTNDRGHNASMVFAGSTLWIAYEDRTTGELIRARSVSPFNTFSFDIQAGGVEPSLTADGSGFLDMVWRETVNNTLQRLRCLNAACSSAAQITLAGGGRGFRPSATRTPSGNLLVSHFEPAANNLRGTLCPDAACTAPQALLFDSGQGIAGKSLVRNSSAGLPLVFYHESLRADVQSVQCTTAACTAFTRRTAFNGLPVSGVRVAVRPDGRAVVAYIRQREPWLALCSDALCSSLSRVTLPGGNSDTRPDIAIRPDNRPVGYYASFGGSELYDCANANCTAGSSRTVSGSGNSTSNVIEIALRADGRPVLLYTISNANDVFVFDCADIGCTSGSQRLLIDEPTANSTFLYNFAIAIGTGNRPIVMYALNSTGGTQQRFLRCSDSACTSATARTIGTNAPFFNTATPLAVRSDGRPVFIENGPNNLAICNDADCTGLTRFPIGIAGFAARTLRLLAGDRPVYEAGGTGIGTVTVCDDAPCSTAEQRVALSDTNAQSFYLGSLGLDASGAAYAAFEEQTLADIVLAVPLPEVIFANGFE